MTTPGATFTHPITLNLYALGTNGAVGSLIATRTQTFKIKFRPSSDTTNCPLDGVQPSTATAWYDTKLGECDHGLAQKITFNLGAMHLTLPNQFVYGIAFNTSGYGMAPYGYSTTVCPPVTGCAYDALNVGRGQPGCRSVAMIGIPTACTWTPAAREQLLRADPDDGHLPPGRRLLDGLQPAREVPEPEVGQRSLGEGGRGTVPLRSIPRPPAARTYLRR